MINSEALVKQLAKQRIEQEFGKLRVLEHLIGSVIDDQFEICSRLAEGTFAQVYNAKNLKKKIGAAYQPLVIKFTRHHGINEKEYKVLQDI
jgi:hypothetical protein